ncbi:hypothetical protein TNCV_4915581 [Trichonephila clavipes]|nr:hypothetical protein TNCV_4915581 [Trichonephila clavipes]
MADREVLEKREGKQYNDMPRGEPVEMKAQEFVKGKTLLLGVESCSFSACCKGVTDDSKGIRQSNELASHTMISCCVAGDIKVSILHPNVTRHVFAGHKAQLKVGIMAEIYFTRVRKILGRIR